MRNTMDRRHFMRLTAGMAGLSTATAFGLQMAAVGSAASKSVRHTAFLRKEFITCPCVFPSKMVMRSSGTPHCVATMAAILAEAQKEGRSFTKADLRPKAPYIT